MGPHAASHRPGTHADRRSRAAAAGRGHARRRLSRPRQAGNDGVHRRTNPLAQPRGGRCGADPCRPGSPECSQHERLPRASTGGRAGGTASEARHVAQEHQRGRRRRLPAAREEGGPGTTGSAGQVGLLGTTRTIRLLGDRLVSGTGPRAGCRARRPTAAAARASPAETGSGARARNRPDPEGGLRAPTRWARNDDGTGARRSPKNHQTQEVRAR